MIHRLEEEYFTTISVFFGSMISHFHKSFHLLEEFLSVVLTEHDTSHSEELIQKC